MTNLAKDYITIDVQNKQIIITFIGPCNEVLVPMCIKTYNFDSCFNPNPMYDGGDYI